jgi:hypothetical protein
VKSRFKIVVIIYLLLLIQDTDYIFQSDMKWFYCSALSEKYIDFIFSTSATASASALAMMRTILTLY